jgi:hypothetical protein
MSREDESRYRLARDPVVRPITPDTAEFIVRDLDDAKLEAARF